MVAEFVPRTVRAGLIGSGIEASRSPSLHMEEGARQGLDYSYELFDLLVFGDGADALSRVLAGAESRSFAGLNVTHPCKQAVIAHLHELSRDADALGAVNTVVFKGHKRIGHNTDWSGFTEGFRRGLPGARLDHIVVLGAGGAGAAVGLAALTMGCRELTLFDVRSERAELLVGKLRRLFPDRRATAGQNLADAMRRADGLIHATPTGMVGHPGMPLPEEFLNGRHWVVDIVYFPLETELLKAARRRGCRTLDGGNMMVLQAAGAFELFTGLRPDTERMLRHFSLMAGR